MAFQHIGVAFADRLDEFLENLCFRSGEFQLPAPVVAKLHGLQRVVGGGRDRQLEAVDLIEAQPLEQRAAGRHEILLHGVVDGEARGGAEELPSLLKIRPRLEFCQELEGAMTFQRQVLDLAIETLQVDLLGEPEERLERLRFGGQCAVEPAEDGDLRITCGFGADDG